MSNDTGELRALLEFAVEMTREAGELTLRYFRREFKTERKSDERSGTDFVTEADIEAERFLRRKIEERFPQDAVLGEEQGERAGSSGRRWIIDPIDGTFSFVHGVPLYGVLVGLEIEDEPVLGVVHLPALGEIVSAARGLGCFWNGRPTRVSTTSSLAQALLLTTDFGACEHYGFGAGAAELQRSVAARRTWGDCYGYVLVATGRADVMFDPSVSVWDCAPLLPIIEEAGGTFTDLRGQRTIRGGDAIATNGALFEEVMETIRGKSG
jgi:histidinol phosphatase-like enzyme (inositol monophosphatase family)